MKRILTGLLLCVYLLAAVPAFATVEPISYSGGWNETIWFEAPDVFDADVTAVSYTGPVSGSLSGQDFEYLVRDTENGLRIDIPGLPAGSYELTVTTKWWTFCERVTVTAQDRSGFAHFGDTEGVGAYDNEGKLKENAIVLYVTEENKDTVTITSKDGTTVSGIGNILNTKGRQSRGGSLTNTNQDILRKLAADGAPLVVRIIGKVTAPVGLTAWGSYDYGGNPDDNGSMARMEGGKHITIEGIGEGATVDGWGLHFICGGGDYARGWGRSFEVRNLTFVNVPEDCVGMEGDQKDNVLEAPVERCWIHHCAFYGPTILNDASDDQDKGGGDGACDFKRGQYFTNSYCYYYGYHKTNLVGGSDSNLQYHITYHHNYWKNCESRAPLARQADIHMYNNIFENQSSYCMNPRANAYIFSEFNLFLNSKDPIEVKSGAVKSYGDVFQNCRGNNQGTIVSDRSQTVATGNKYANFDTNAELSYIPDRDYILQENMEEMKAVVVSQTGPQGLSFEDPAPDVPDIGDITMAPGSYVHDFTESGKQGEFFIITGNLSTSKGSVSFNGKTLTQCLKMESSSEIRFGAPEKGSLLLVFGGSTDAAGKTVKVDGTKYTVDADGTLEIQVAAGWHTVTKGDSINLFYMAYTSDSAPQEHVHEHKMEVTKQATCVEAGEAVYTCDCGDSYTKALPMASHSYTVEVAAPTCTEGGGVLHKCTVCGTSYTDAPTAATGHSYMGEVKAATCTQDEKTVYTCGHCGDAYEETTGVAVGHRYVPEETETATVYTCTACKHSYRIEKPQQIPDEKDDQDTGMPGWVWVLPVAVCAVGAAAVVVLKKKKSV